MSVLGSAVALWLLAGAPAAAGPAAPAAAPQKVSKSVSVRLPGGRTLEADLADTPASREKGLMFRRKLPKDYGMLFAFPQEMGLTFWMKNTFVSLDIVFIGADRRITRLHERVRPSTERTPDDAVARVGGKAQFVLELPAGAARRYKLAEGQTLGFDARAPSL